MYLLAPFTLQNFKKFLESIQGYEHVPFSDPKLSISLNKNFFGKNHYYFMYLLVPFIVRNFKKIIGADPELSRCTIFGPKMFHFAKTRFFWEKSSISFSSTYWPLSLYKIFKKILTADPEL